MPEHTIEPNLSSVMDNEGPRLRKRIADLEAEVAVLRGTSKAGRKRIGGLGGTIQRLREEKGMSLSDLSRASGCSKSMISRIETSAEPNLELRNIQRLAAGLGLRLSQLFGEVERDE